MRSTLFVKQMRSTLFIRTNLFNKQLVSNRGVSLYSGNIMVNNKIQIIDNLHRSNYIKHNLELLMV